jgi:hypothetical protein
MKIITLGFGILLMLLGIGSYVQTGAASLTALIPAGFGLAIFILGLFSRPEKGTPNTALFGAVFVAILGVIASIRGVLDLVTLLTGGEVARPAATIAQSVMAGLCILLVVLAVVLTPDFWQGWKAFGHVLGNLVARVVLTVFYFTVFVPFALGVKLFSDPLHLKSTATRLWQTRTTGDQTLEEVLRQY